MVVYQLNTYDIDKYQTARIIDEDGNKIYDFGYSYQFAVAGFQKYNNELRMTLLHYNSLSTSFEIYKCAGTGGNTQSISHIQKTAETKAFPNPATNTITLTYNLASGNASEIQIFNSNGQLVKTIPVGPHFNEVQVDVTAFPKGIYFYKCEGATNQFVVQ